MPSSVFWPLLAFWLLPSFVLYVRFPNCKCGRDAEFSNGFLPFTRSPRVIPHVLESMWWDFVGVIPLLVAAVYYGQWVSFTVSLVFMLSAGWTLWRHEKGKWKRKAVKAYGKVTQLANGRLAVVPT